jgi:hypothetical protein
VREVLKWHATVLSESERPWVLSPVSTVSCSYKGNGPYNGDILHTKGCPSDLREHLHLYQPLVYHTTGYLSQVVCPEWLGKDLASQ